MTPKELRLLIASKAKERRLFLDITQKELAERSGVSLGSIKRFESTGQISLSALLEISLVLNALDEFSLLFPSKEATASLFADIPKKRQRGSGKRS